MPHVTAYLLDVYYTQTNNDVTIHLLCKHNDQLITLQDTHFRPYFYVQVEAGEESAVREQLLNLATEEAQTPTYVESDPDNPHYIRVYAAIPAHIPKLRKTVKEWPAIEETYEYDIPFTKRYMVDKGLYPFTAYTFDVEHNDNTYHVQGIQEAQGDASISVIGFDLETVDDTIIMASFYGEHMQKVITTQSVSSSHAYVEHVSSESELIRRVFTILAQWDVVIGYNTDTFDFPLLRSRAHDLGVEVQERITPGSIALQSHGHFSTAHIKGIVHLDMFHFVTLLLHRQLEAETLSLHDVAQAIIGEGKDDVSWRDIYAAWKSGKELDTIIQYALKDAELVYKIGTEYLSLITSVSRLTGLTPYHASRSTYGQLVEQYLIRNAAIHGRFVPPKPQWGAIQQRRNVSYEGGYVVEPEEGVYENLVMFDYRSLYPSILIAHNISPDTAQCACCAETERQDGFCNKHTGFLPSVMKSVMEQRTNIKHRLQTEEHDEEIQRQLQAQSTALKYILNSSYGYMGYPGARWYCKECAEKITELGRQYIKQTIEKAREWQLPVIYGDTDSILIQSTDDNQILEFQQTVNALLPEEMELEQEGRYIRGLFTSTKSGKGAKKKYALLSYNDELQIKGFEQVRRDWCELAKTLQEDIIRAVLHNKPKRAFHYVKNTIADIQNGNVALDNLRIYTRLTKDPFDYTSTAPHVAAAKKAVEYGMQIEKGDTIAYIITQEGDTISDRAVPAELANTYDAEYYMHHQIIPVSLRILGVCGYTENDLLEPGRQTGLGHFITSEEDG